MVRSCVGGQPTARRLARKSRANGSSLVCVVRRGATVKFVVCSVSLKIGPLFAGPDVDEISSVGFQLLEPQLGLLLAGVGVGPMDVDECTAHAVGHGACPAHVDDGAACQQAKDLVAELDEPVLHVHSRFVGQSRVGARLSDDACAFVIADLVSVELVVLRMAAAERQQRWTERDALFTQCCTFLQEAAERGDSGAAAIITNGVAGSAGSRKFDSVSQANAWMTPSRSHASR